MSAVNVENADADSFCVSYQSPLIERRHFATSFAWKIAYVKSRTNNEIKTIISPIFQCSSASWQLTYFPESCLKTDHNLEIKCRAATNPFIFWTYIKFVILDDKGNNLGELAGRKCVFNSKYPSVIISLRDLEFQNLSWYRLSSLVFDFSICVVEDSIPDFPFKEAAKESKGEKTSVKKDAGTNTSSKDFGNLCFHKDPPTEKEHYLTLTSKDFEEMYNNQRFADVVLKLREHEFPVHKLILRSRSKVFEAMFEHDMQENRQDTVDLVDMEVHTVRDMLRYIYCGKVRQLSPEEALNLYVAADRYDLQELVLHCHRVILNTLSVGNLCEVSAVADLHNDQLLTNKVISILCKNMKEVLKTEKWKMFAKENPALSLKLISLAILNE